MLLKGFQKNAANNFYTELLKLLLLYQVNYNLYTIAPTKGDEQVVDTGSTREYYELTAESFRMPNYDFWIPTANRLVQMSDFGNILEIGCGVGAEARFFGDITDYFAVDITKGFLEQTRHNTNQQKLAQANMQRLPFKAKSFDAFWCAASLLHIPKLEIDSVLREIWRCLKPGAFGFISLKQGEGEDFVTNPGQDQLPPRFFAFWQYDEFVEHLQKANFRVVKFYRKTTPDRANPHQSVTWLCFFVKKPIYT